MPTDPSQDSLSASAKLLLDAERDRPGAPPDFGRHLWERVAATVAPPPTPARAWTGLRQKLLAGAGVMTLGAALGGGVVGAIEHQKVKSLETELSALRQQNEALAAKREPEPVIAEGHAPAVEEPKRVQPSRRKAERVVEAPASNVLDEESILVDQVRTALLRREPAAALVAIEEHSRRFPSGQLAEEREALRIQVLIHLKRADEAHAAADAFRRRFPQSLLQSGIDDVLRGP